MKKILSILLCLCMLSGCGALFAGAADEELIINVANDLHYEPGYVPTVGDDAYAHVSGSGQLYGESVAVIAAFLEAAAKDDSKVVLIPGDLVDDGVEEEHKGLSAILASFEAATGKQVYVVPGNHDLFKTSVDEFRTYYAEFGYNEAIAKDTLSASYVAELSDEYRLLAIDSTDPGKSPWGITAERTQWIRQQAEKAKQDGKKVIAMIHHNVLNHLILINTLNPGSVIDYSVGLREIFAEYGIKYTFTGHTHEHDIASYTGANGEVIYEAVTGSLISYPCPYRKVTFGDEVKIETKRVDEINPDLVYIKDFMSDEAYGLMTTDFTEYSKVCVFLGVRNNLNNSFLTSGRLKSLLKINNSTESEISALLDKVTPKFREAINMPLYAEDETEEGKSIESILAAYDVTIPDSKYQDMMEVAITVYENHVAGDENMQAYSNEVVLASKGIGALLIYALSDVTAQEYAQALTFVCNLLKVDVPANLINYAGDGIRRFEGIELVISTAILPLILKVTVDDAPADCDITLPGYADLIESAEEENLTFWQKIEAFFIKIFSFIMSLFAFI